jgi:poly-gamma-glutamate synthesis protein (capsule biosynthesis protein)
MRNRYNLSFRREQQKKERIKRIMIIIIILVIFAALGTLIYFAWNNIDWSSIGNSTDKKNQVTKEETKKPKTVDLTINSVGEITMYSAQLNAAETEDGYDFADSFKDVKKYTEDADLTLFDLETTFGGEPYEGYPDFNSPDELADAIKDAGFDIAVTANEHAFDSDIEGVERTIDTLDNAGLKVAGTRKDEKDKDYLITTVNGLKVGVVAYAEETSYNPDNRALAGEFMEDEETPLINSYSPNLMDEDMERVKSTIEDARADGAQVIITYFHWGDDYDSGVNEQEEEIATALADMGSDMIFATGPHAVQEMDSIKSEDGRDVPVFYSLGNFLSAQRYGTVGDAAVEEGIIGQVKLTVNTKTNKISNIDYGYIPTWTDMYWNNDKELNNYVVVPLVGDLETDSVLEESENLTDAEDALENLVELLGEPLISTDSSETAGDSGTEE